MEVNLILRKEAFTMKTKMSKKFFSVFLAIVMAVAIIPIATMETNAESLDFIWPCESSFGISTMYYYSSGSQHHCRKINGSRIYHNGLDIWGSGNIVAVADGKVLKAGADGDWGNRVIIEHADGSTTLYAHLKSVSVKAGDSVKQGKKIGVMGSTGNSTGTHLHFDWTGGNPWVEFFRDKYYEDVTFTSNVYNANKNKDDVASEELKEFIDSYYTLSGGSYVYAGGYTPENK